MRLIVKNKPSIQFDTGDVIFIGNDDHIFGRMESLTKFLESGGNKSDWPYELTIINAPDAEQSNYQFLNDINEDLQRSYYLEPQGTNSPYWDDISAKGEVTLTKEQLNELIRVR